MHAYIKRTANQIEFLPEPLILPPWQALRVLPHHPMLMMSQDGVPGTAMTGRILIVEDEYFIAMECEDWLREAGYEVVGVCASAADALASVEAARPDLVVMDIRLRGAVDGIEAAIEIWRDYGIRSLFASAHSDPMTRARAAAAEPAGFVDKPYSRADFLAAIARAIAKLR